MDGAECFVHTATYYFKIAYSMSKKDNTTIIEEKTYPLKVPVYVSKRIEADDANSFDSFAVSQENMIDLAKKHIDDYNSNPKAHVVSDYKSKTTTIGIDSIAYEDIAFNKDKCLLLRATAYKSNLIDGFYQQQDDEGHEIRFKQKDKLCSDTYIFILYPLIVKDLVNDASEIFWHIFIYEDPSKVGAEIVKIAKLIMGQIIKAPIRNIKSDKMLADIRKYDLISKVEISLSTIGEDEEGIPEYIKNYTYKCSSKREQKISLENMSVDDAVLVFNDKDFTKWYNRRSVKFSTYNKRLFSMVQEFKDKMTESFEDSFNYSIEIKESAIKDKSIFETENIKKNVGGIFSSYLAANTND